MPDQRTLPKSCTEPVFVGFAGRTGSGKTLAATYLSSKYSFQYKRYSEVLRKWASPVDANRAELQRIGWKIMTGSEQTELNALLIAELDRSRSAAIDGLRHSIDLQSLRAAFGVSFEMIFLDARQENRFERLRTRFSTFDGFRAADSHPVEGYIDDLRTQASTRIPNDDSPEHLYQQLDSWVLTRRLGDRR